MHLVDTLKHIYLSEVHKFVMYRLFTFGPTTIDLHISQKYCFTNILLKKKYYFSAHVDVMVTVVSTS